MMRLLWFFADLTEKEWNTSRQRVTIPAEALHEAGRECRLASISELFKEELSPAVQESIQQADVVILERLLITPVNKRIKEMKAMGKKVYATFDDNYALMPIEPKRKGAASPSEVWRGGKDALDGRGSILNQFREGLSLCTGALVPSKLLMEDYRAYQLNMYYVPNFPNKKLWENLPSPRQDVIIAGYGGTSHHNLSVNNSGLIPALSSLSRKYPKFYTHLQTPFQDVVKNFDKSKVRYSLGNWLPIDQWCKTLATFNIGLAPLYGSYDERRSFLKCADYACGGVPWVATDGMPYKEARGGLLTDNKPRSWEKAIESLIKDKELRDSLIRDGKAWVDELSAISVKCYEDIFNG